MNDLGDHRPSLLGTGGGIRGSGGGIRAAAIAATLGWVWSRVCVALGFVAADVLSGRVSMPHGELHLSQGLLTWDADIYRSIAQGWYGSLPAEVARFFPLFPWMAQRVAWIPGIDEGAALVLIGNLSALAAGVVLWKLTVEVRGSDDVGITAAWMLAVFPSGYILAFGYSEGLVLLLTAAYLLALARRKWLWLAVLGFVLALTRPVGILVGAPLLVELITKLPKPWYKAVPALLGPPAGLCAALVWVSRATNDFWAPVTIQRQLRAGWLDPLRASGRAVYKLVTGEWGYAYNVGFLVLFTVLFVLSIRQKQPWSWIAFSAATLVVALSAYNIDSLGRYGLVAVPLVVAAAQWADTRRRKVAAITIASGGTVVLTCAAMLGVMVP
ncbi:MAG: hypothetical protein ACK5O2_03995 [Microthrixaceae bacterium]